MARTPVPLICGISAALAILTWIAFGQTRHSEFVNFDDDAYVYENGVVQGGLNSAGIDWAFTHVVASNWHPLTMMSHMLDCQLYGLDAGKHHLTNVLLHAATAILLCLVLRQMTGAIWPGAFVAAVFAVHPLRAESVAWVSERKDVLSGLFFVLTLGAYVRYARKPTMLGNALVLILFVLGLLSKPMLVTLPFILLLLDYWPLKRFRTYTKSGAGSLRQLIVEKIPFIALSLLACVAVYWFQEKARAAAENIPFLLRISNTVVSCALYIGQLFYPAKLAAFYPYPPTGHSLPEIAISGIVLAGISILVYKCRLKAPYLLVGWLWYLVMLLPVIGLVQVAAQAHADRYTYLPEIGLCIALTWGIAEYAKHWKTPAFALSAGAAVIIATLTALARAQAASWHDSKTLWEHALACTTNNSVAEGNLANEFLHEGQFDEAIQHAGAAIEMDPKFADAQNCLGYALFQTGRLAEAVTHLQEAVNIWPDFASAQNNLGMALLRAGKLDEAIRHFEAAVKIQPEMGDAQSNLGAALVQKGEPEAAVPHYEIAIKLKPDHVGAGNNYAWLLASCTNASVRNGAKAVELARRANTASGSQNLIVLRTLAAAYAENGQFKEAVEVAGQALQLATAQNNATWIRALQAEINLYQSGQPFRADGKTP